MLTSGSHGRFATESRFQERFQMSRAAHKEPYIGGASGWCGVCAAGGRGRIKLYSTIWNQRRSTTTTRWQWGLASIFSVVSETYFLPLAFNQVLSFSFSSPLCRAFSVMYSSRFHWLFLSSCISHTPLALEYTLYFRAFRSSSRYSIFINRILASLSGSRASPCLYRRHSLFFLDASYFGVLSG